MKIFFRKMSIYKVSHELFSKADKQLEEVRFVKSLDTNKWYLSVVDAAELTGANVKVLDSKPACYHWDETIDGKCLYSLKNMTKALKRYFPVDALVGMFFANNEEQQKALKPSRLMS